MKFFVDTADTAEIAELAATGLLDGVTTNPSLIMKAGRPMKDVIAEICKITDGPVSAEVAATDYEGIMREAKVLAAIAPNVVIKLPLTMDGLKACKALTSAGHKTNVTLCFSATQALLAAKAGATYISPFIGRHALSPQLFDQFTVLLSHHQRDVVRSQHTGHTPPTRP